MTEIQFLGVILLAFGVIIAFPTVQYLMSVWESNLTLSLVFWVVVALFLMFAGFFTVWWGFMMVIFGSD